MWNEIASSARRALLVSLLALVGVGSGVGVAACGGSGPARTSTTSSVSIGSASQERRTAAQMRNHESYAIGDGLVRPVRSFGQAASPREERAVAALVEHYYAVAAAQDSNTACKLISAALREAIPEEYGAPPGPLYLRGVTTCEEFLSIVFKRFHTALSSPPRVTGVRIHGNQALALLAWRGFPPGFIEVQRERGTWKIRTPLAAPIP